MSDKRVRITIKQLRMILGLAQEHLRPAGQDIAGWVSLEEALRTALGSVAPIADTTETWRRDFIIEAIAFQLSASEQVAAEFLRAYDESLAVAAPATPDVDAAFRAATEAVTKVQAIGGHWEPDQLAYAAVKAALVVLGVQDRKVPAFDKHFAGSAGAPAAPAPDQT